MKRTRFFRVLFLTGMMMLMLNGLAVAGGSQDGAEESGKFRVALLLDGNITDGGWNGLPYQGLMKAIEDFDIEGSYTEQIPKEEIMPVMLDYADSGYDLVIANGYPFSDAIQTVSNDFPDTMFIGLNMPAAGPNLATARITYGINGYLAGVLLGNMTKTNKVGIVAAVDSPQQQIETGNMQKAIGQIDPAIELKFVFTGDWSDISLAREGASSLIDSGCDIILNNIDGATGAVATLAEERGIFVLGWTGDEVHLNPDVILSSLLIRNDVVIYSAIKAVLEGKYSPGSSMQFGMDTGALGFGEFGNSIGQDIIDICKTAQEAVANGSTKVNTVVPGWD